MSLGVSEVIAYVIIFFIAISLTATAYLYIIPTISSMRTESELDYMIIQMKKLDDRIKSVARGGEGTKDFVSISIRQGSLQISSDDKIIYVVPGKTCLQRNVSGLYFEFEQIYDICLNKIILNYTAINITNNASFSGSFDIWIENIGYSQKPLLKVS